MNLYEEFLRYRSALTFRLAPYSWLDDKHKIEYLFYKKMGNKLDLKNPKTFNEKMQWNKLYYRNPLCTKLSDKYAVREYIAGKIGVEYLNELLMVYESPEEIDWESLPKQFAMKLTHGSHWNIICPDKDLLNIQKAKAKINHWYKRNYYHGAREWQYKLITPRIVVEKYIDDGNGALPLDYKFYCFNGRAEYIQVTKDDNADLSYYFNRNWNFQRINHSSIKAPEDFYFDKPELYQIMIEISDFLAQPFPFVRVDFFYIGGRLIFGELTFTPTSGFNTDRIKEIDYVWGNLLTLQRMT